MKKLLVGGFFILALISLGGCAKSSKSAYNELKGYNNKVEEIKFKDELSKRFIELSARYGEDKLDYKLEYARYEESENKSILNNKTVSSGRMISSEENKVQHDYSNEIYYNYALSASNTIQKSKEGKVESSARTTVDEAIIRNNDKLILLNHNKMTKEKIQSIPSYMEPNTALERIVAGLAGDKYTYFIDGDIYTILRDEKGLTNEFTGSIYDELEIAQLEFKESEVTALSYKRHNEVADNSNEKRVVGNEFYNEGGIILHISLMDLSLSSFNVDKYIEL